MGQDRNKQRSSTIALVLAALVVCVTSAYCFSSFFLASSAATDPLVGGFDVTDPWLRDDGPASDDLEAQGDIDPRAARDERGDPTAAATREAGADPTGDAARRSTRQAEQRRSVDFRGRTVTPDGATLTGVRLEAFLAPPRSAAIEPSSAGHATSQQDGRFAGAFVAGARIEVFLLASIDGYAPTLRRFDLRPGVAEIDFGDVLVQRGYSVQGHVVNGSGSAIAAAQVRWHSLGHEFLERFVVACATDARGEFRFDGLPNVDFVLTVVAEGFGALRSPFLPAGATKKSRSTDGAIVLDVGRLVLDSGLSVGGVVRSRRSGPLAGARVRIEEHVRSKKPLPDSARAATSRVATTDEHGRFLIDHVVGTPRITASADGHVTAHRVLGTLTNRLFVELDLEPKARLHGVVVDATTGRIVEDYAIRPRRVPSPKDLPAKKGPPSATLAAQKVVTQRYQAFGASGQRPAWLPPQEKHSDGRFDFTDLDPGHYLIDVGSDEHIRRALGPFEASNISQAAPLVLRVERGVSLRGRVVSRASQAPVRRARVELLAERRDDKPGSFDPLTAVLEKREADLVLEETRTRGDGSFVLGPRPAGTYRLRIREAKGFEDRIVAPIVLSTERAQSTLEVTVDAAAELYGRVTHLPAGKRAIIVLASTSGRRFEIKTDEKGDYACKDMAAGKWFARVHVEGQAWGAFRHALEAVAVQGRDGPDLELAAGERRRLDFDAARSLLGRLYGCVRHNGQVVKDATLQLSPKTTWTPPTSPERKKLLRDLAKAALQRKTDAEGRFDFDPAVPGLYELVLRIDTKQGRIVDKRDVVIGAATLQDIELRTFTVQLRATVLGNGAQARGLRMALALEDEASGIEWRRWRSLPSARFLRFDKERLEVASLRPGRYRWVAFGGGHVLTEGSFDLRGDRELSIQVARR